MQGGGLGLEKGTDPVGAMVKGAQARSLDAGTRAKDVETEDFIAAQESRRKKRRAAGMEADEFVSPQGQESRQVAQQTTTDKNKRAQQITAQATFWDTTNSIMTEGSTQEDYNEIFPKISASIQKDLGLTGDVKKDKPLIRGAIDSIKNSPEHVRALEEIAFKGKYDTKPAGKLHKPTKPTALDRPMVMSSLQAHPGLADLSKTLDIFTTDADELERLGEQVNSTYVGMLNKNHQLATMASSQGQPWNHIDLDSASVLNKAIERELAMHLDLENPGKYMNVQDAQLQENAYIDKQMKQYAGDARLAGLSPEQRISMFRDDYNRTMMHFAHTVKNTRNETAAYGQRRTNVNR